MENMFLQACIIAVLYLVIKFIEMRIVIKENKPVKILLRDTIIVYISSVMGLYIIGEFLINGESKKTVTRAFVDNPTF